jgi:hypothetical protein
MLFVQDRTQEVWGFPVRYVTRPLTYLLAGAVGAATLGLALLSARRGRGEGTLDADVSLFLLMMFLVAPLSWEHHLVYALPAALLALNFLLKGPTRPAAALFALAALLVLAWDFPRDDMFHLKGVLGLSNAIKFFAALGLWLFVAERMWDGLRDGAAAAEAEG